jgi:plasmid stability protein
MTKLQINLPDDAKARLEARAAEEGFASIEHYAEALLVASTQPQEEELGKLLVARDEDDRPDIEFTPQFAEAFREQVSLRRRSGGQPQ